ncbi:hypothetical protein GIB67_040825 [Kingdonia uniflora]|uniref:Transmembrane protein 220 n=1 Tax=Kingdonia uniflora TaxID=39325 RepID=A0A7J7P4Y4_9MAGN|nr:hypothetical protein GIB67_040825 [Kingdonia uniflora]
MAEEPTKVFRLCSLLMSCLFAYSAAVQLNDPDWYLWIPLYTSASAVNLQFIITISTRRKLAKFGFCVGLFLFFKVMIEQYYYVGSEFWSLDLNERIVREKLGSGIVVISMFLHLQSSSSSSSAINKVDFGG